MLVVSWGPVVASFLVPSYSRSMSCRNLLSYVTFMCFRIFNVFSTRLNQVALKTLIVIHRALREVDPTFQEELLNYGRSRNHVLNLSYFKHDSRPNAWDYSGWVRVYALYLEERLECFRVLKYDVETERPRTKDLDTPDLLEQLPALQQLLFRVLGCQQPQGAAVDNFVIQLALSMAWLLDQFGVLHDGKQPYPGAISTFENLAARGAKMVIISNSSRRASTTLDKLKSLGFDPSLFIGAITSGELTYQHLQRRDDPRFKVLGMRCIHMTWSDRGAISLEKEMEVGCCNQQIDESTLLKESLWW